MSQASDKHTLPLSYLLLSDLLKWVSIFVELISGKVIFAVEYYGGIESVVMLSESQRGW